MRITQDAVSVTLLVATFAATLALYGQLPDPMPTHFDLNGNPDRYTSKPWGAFLLPVVALLAWLGLRILPAISPRNFSMDSFRDSWQWVVVAVVALLVGVHIAMLWSISQNDTAAIGVWVPVMVGALFCVVGNMLNKTEPNFFMGIRTPWTLANPEVWARTHRAGGWAFVAMGVVMALAALLLPPAPAVAITLTMVTVVALGLVLYSYLLYRKLQP